MESKKFVESSCSEDSLTLQHRLTKIAGRMSDVKFSLKKIEVELHELESLKEDDKIYRQVARMFTEQSVGSLRADLKNEWSALNEELPRLREIERELRSRLLSAQAGATPASLKA